MGHKFHLALIIILQAFSYSHQMDDDAWKIAATYLGQAMNETALPCEDFYEHVCGNYDPKDKSMFENDMGKIMLKAIQGVNIWKNSTPKYQSVVKVFFDKCISVGEDTKYVKRLYDAIANQIGHFPLFEKLNPAGAAADGASFKDPWYLIGFADRELGQTVILDGSVDFVKEGFEMKPELQIEPSLPPPEEDGDEPGSSLNITDIQLLVLDWAKAIGLDESKVQSEIGPWMQKLRDFYIDWLNVSLTVGDDDRVALQDLSTFLPDFNWESYLNGLLPDKPREYLKSNLTNEIFISNMEIMGEIGQLFKKHDTDIIRSFVFLTTFYSLEDRYFGEIGEEYKQLRVKAKTPRDRCLEFALRHYAPAMVRLYFDAIGVDALEWRYDVNAMARNIVSAFQFLLNGVDWLDAEDKEKVQAKVDDIMFNCGIPEWINDDHNVMDRIIPYNVNLDLFENEFLSSRIASDRMASRLLLDEDGHTISPKEVEPDPSFEKNAEYDPDSNQINLFIGQIVPPFYNMKYPLPLKYGGFGTILAHEMMHALDPNNIYNDYNNKSNLRPKTQEPARKARAADLKAESLKEFEEKKSCLVSQYSSYCYKGNKCVSGERTVAENMADIDGIKVAYTAYRVVTQVLGSDPPIPGMIHYTNDQMFFLAFARNWCSKEEVTWSRLEDEHTPDKARVELGLGNVDLFSKAFKCTDGSKYSPASRCSLWGDLREPSKRWKH